MHPLLTSQLVADRRRALEPVPFRSACRAGKRARLAASVTYLMRRTTGSSHDWRPSALDGATGP